MSGLSPRLLDARDAAKASGLIYAATEAPGIARSRRGKGFAYHHPGGEKVVDMDTLTRIRSLAIPPAWSRVWICTDPKGHIQAFGFDDKGRRQYRYHPAFRQVRDAAKFEHVIAFAEALPALRRRIEIDMARPGLGRDKVLATVAHLLETTMIRIGNAAYAKQNGSFGLTTLRSRHVRVEGSQLRFHFKGKGGKTWRVGVHDRRVARVVKRIQDLPGQHLFQYVDDAGAPQAITSDDVNAYLREASGTDITAKDFRTWAATVLAARALAELGPDQEYAGAKHSLASAIEQVAKTLGNTPAICRKCYIHPAVIDAYLNGDPHLPRPMTENAAPNQLDLGVDERAVLKLLREHGATKFATQRSGHPE